MKITTENYFEQIKKIGAGKLPEPLQNSHELISEKTRKGKDWSIYKSDEELKSVIDLSFEKLGEFIKHGKHSMNGIEADTGLEGPAKAKKKKNDYSEEVKFFEVLLDWQGRMITAPMLLSFIESLQLSIVTHTIRKNSPFAKEINFIQQHLLEIYNNLKLNYVMFKMKDETEKMLQSAIKKAAHLQKPKHPQPRPEKIKSVELSGTQEPEPVLEATKETVPEVPYQKAEPAPAPNIMSSMDFANLTFATIGFKDKWLKLIGDPSRGFSAMIFGKPKMGKSYLAIDFAGYLARNHGKVLYVAKEEKLDATLQLKLNDKEVAHENLFVSDHLPADISDYDFIFLDSVNKLGLAPKDLDLLKANNPGKSFIFIFQTTKDGSFRGKNEFQHDVDIVIEIPERGKAIQFGRFNQGGEMGIFENAESTDPAPLQGFDESVMFAGVSNKKNKMLNEVKSRRAGKTSKKNEKDWTDAEYLSKQDREDLKTIKKLYEARKLKEAMKFASDCDTAIREEIPPAIWKAIGGELTKAGEEKLKSEKQKKNVVDLKKYDSHEDGLNPRFLFSLTATQLLCEALKKEFDIEYLVRYELANRGVDADGKWVGFPKAKELHRID